MHSIEDKGSLGVLYGNELVINFRLVKRKNYDFKSPRPLPLFWTSTTFILRQFLLVADKHSTPIVGII
jgi:hypothetical protein